jgi:TrmH family RNA methyltransferase
MGAVYRSSPGWAEPETIARRCKAQGIPLYVTALSDRAVDLREADLSKAAMVIGREGRGVGAFFLDNADRELIIPMSERCESLNAASAGTVVLWQMSQGTFPR